jgi:hypothetical protein
MALLAELTGVRRYLEIGTFTGYSTLSVALAMPADGEVVACDVSEDYTAVARRYWAEAGVAGRIDLRIAPALETLDTLLAEGRSGSFDFAFIDADKENYAGAPRRPARGGQRAVGRRGRRSGQDRRRDRSDPRRQHGATRRLAGLPLPGADWRRPDPGPQTLTPQRRALRKPIV